MGVLLLSRSIPLAHNGKGIAAFACGMLTRGMEDRDEGPGQRPRPWHAHRVGAHHAWTANGSMREGIPRNWHPPEPRGEGCVGEGRL